MNVFAKATWLFFVGHQLIASPIPVKEEVGERRYCRLIEDNRLICERESTSRVLHAHHRVIVELESDLQRWLCTLCGHDRQMHLLALLSSRSHLV